MQIKRAASYGFCAGVRVADEKVRKFARLGGSDGRILGQVVHNERVVEEMRDLGLPTVESLEEAGEGTLVFSAHGVPPSYHERAQAKGLKILDTTCPFVYDIHEEADRAVAAARADTICYATKENQDAAWELCADSEVDLVLVIGGRRSANTRHLWETCRELKPAHLVHSPDDIEAEWLAGVSTVGITAGASTPDYAIDEIETRLMELAGVVGDPGGGTRITGTEAPGGATSAGGRSS